MNLHEDYQLLIKIKTHLGQGFLANRTWSRGICTSTFLASTASRKQEWQHRKEVEKEAEQRGSCLSAAGCSVRGTWAHSLNYCVSEQYIVGGERWIYLLAPVSHCSAFTPKGIGIPPWGCCICRMHTSPEPVQAHAPARRGPHLPPSPQPRGALGQEADGRKQGPVRSALCDRLDTGSSRASGPSRLSGQKPVTP